MTPQNTSDSLRTGFTTGTCAAAAAKGALLALRPNANIDAISPVEIKLPNGAIVELPLSEIHITGISSAKACVLKNSGDDPDITNGMSIWAEVCVGEEVGDIEFMAGNGVGTVQKPGLQIPIGEPAINPVPRKIIAQSVREVEPTRKVQVTISIPGGTERALNTFNPKLGIEGGLSILGTSGIVIPRSQDAWFRSLLPQLDIAKALGLETIFVSPGSFGAELRKSFSNVPSEAVIHAGNFIGDVLLECKKRNFTNVIIAGHAGKLVKFAAGIMNTHSELGDARLETIAAHAALCGASQALVARIMNATTAEACVSILRDSGMNSTWFSIAQKAAERASLHAQMPVDVVVTAYGELVLGWSKNLNEIFPSEPPQNLIHVVGLGPGPEHLTSPAAWQLICQSPIVVGGKRQLESVSHLKKTTHAITANMETTANFIREHKNSPIVILSSGDPTCYGVFDFVRREFPNRLGRVVPAVSSFQLALARLQKSWAEVGFASCHGRSPAALLQLLETSQAVLTLTDTSMNPIAIAKAVCEHFPKYEFDFTVLEELGYDSEKTSRFTNAHIPNVQFHSLSVMLVEKHNRGVP